MKIIIAGLGGTGKGTVGKILAERLGYRFMSAGEFFRNIAIELEISLSKLEQLAIDIPLYDKRVDAQTEEFGIKNDDFVFDGRIAQHFIPDSETILLTCENEERFRRIAFRDKISLKEAKEVTLQRERAIKERYKNLYGILKFDDPESFGLVIDTTTLCPKDVAFKIEEFVKGERYKSTVKELFST